MPIININEKQKTAADYYIATGNKCDAAELAGYSRSNAARLFKYIAVKQYIKKKVDEMNAENKSMDIKREDNDKGVKGYIADVDEILEFLTLGMRNELFEYEYDGDGNISKKKSMTVSNRVKCAELLSKYYALFSGIGEIKPTPVIIDNI